MGGLAQGAVPGQCQNHGKSLLAPEQVVADRLAGLSAVSEDSEDVVAKLECNTQGASEALAGRHGGVCGPGGDCPQRRGGPHQGAGLALNHLQVLGQARANGSGGRDVGLLATHHL